MPPDLADVRLATQSAGDYILQIKKITSLYTSRFFTRMTLVPLCLPGGHKDHLLYLPLITRPKHCVPGTGLSGPESNFPRLVSKSKKGERYFSSFASLMTQYLTDGIQGTSIFTNFEKFLQDKITHITIVRTQRKCLLYMSYLDL